MQQYSTGFILTEINIYPVKSLGGISLSSSYASEKGLEHDRRWMLIDKNNRFISQRENASMALIGMHIGEKGFELFNKKNTKETFFLPFTAEGRKLEVVIWDDTCGAIHWNMEADEWFAQMLKQDCRLVYMPGDTNRYVNKNYAHKNETVSFADGYPYLVLGEESLKNLNARLAIPLPMNRFRPNFVFSGGNAFDEDEWNECTIGNATFSSTKLCSRCMITTIDQDTAERSPEPMRTLSTFRKQDNNVYFGQNLVVRKAGTVSVGDEIFASGKTT